MVNAGQAVAYKLFGYVGQPITVTLLLLLWRERLTIADFLEHLARPVGDAPVELATLVMIVGPARGVRGVFVYRDQLKCFAVVVGRVPAAMMDYYWMVSRNLVKIVAVELPLVFHFGVIEEISIDPKARRSFLSFCAELIYDAGD